MSDVEILKTALERIESGMPACGVDSESASKEVWRGLYRDLQSIARKALREFKEAKSREAGKVKP